MIQKRCGKNGHTRERCWTVVGYQKWHAKGKRPNESLGYGDKTNKQKAVKMVVNVNTVEEYSQRLLAPQQVEQLRKMFPSSSKGGSKTEDELESRFASMIVCCSFMSKGREWIINPSASDHMVSNANLLINPMKVNKKANISLPNGGTVRISHVGEINLMNNLKL